MGISGIVVAVRPDEVDDCVQTLTDLPGVDTHQLDRAGGRIVVTHEGESLEAHESGLRRIQALPQVLYAELVYHYTGDESAPEPAAGAGRPPSESNAGS